MRKMKCPVCGSDDNVSLVQLDAVPVFCNVLHDTEQSALSAARAPFELRFCSVCAHSFNSVFDPSLVEYAGTYENALHFSPTFRDYASGLAQRLVSQYELHGRTIVEIGSGDGSFLEQLCALGARHGIGFDPSHEAGENGPVTYVNDYFSEKHAEIHPDFVCCRHVLEHVVNPRALLASVRRALSATAHGAVYFEVPNALYTLRDLGIWDLIYEHCGYFSPLSLRTLFESAGYRVARLAETYGGQFLGIDATLGAAKAVPDASTAPDAVSLWRVARAFGSAHEKRVSFWRRRLRQMRDERREVVVWGAGSKGVTFLNIADREGVVRRVVDVNPRKHGKHVCGSGQVVVSPAAIEPGSIDLVLLMNPLYRGEVSAILDSRGIQCAVESVT